MKHVVIIVVSLLLILPAVASGMGLNPFSQSSDSALVKSEVTKTAAIPGTSLALGIGVLAFVAWRRYRH